MKREKVTVKFYDGRDDIIMVSDSISIYDTTEGTTIIKSQGYVDRVIPSDNIKSISLEHIQDKMCDKKINEILDKLFDVRRELLGLANRLDAMEYKCDDLSSDIIAIEKDLEEV